MTALKHKYRCKCKCKGQCSKRRVGWKALLYSRDCSHFVVTERCRPLQPASECPPKKHNEASGEKALEPLGESQSIERWILVLQCWITLFFLPPFADSPVMYRLIRDDTIYLVANTPAHQVGGINGPDIDPPVSSTGFLEKSSTERTHENLLVDVEGDAGHLHELARVAQVETDQGHRISRKVFGTCVEVSS